MLEILTSSGDLASAQKALIRGFRAGAESIKRARISFRPKTVSARVFWHSDLSIWGSLNSNPIDAEDDEGRFWNAFGLEDPTTKQTGLRITVEANPPHEGLNRQVAGLFAKDAETGSRYLLHTGRLGGGKSGINKDTFWSQWPEPAVEAWSQGSAVQAALVADLDSDSVPLQISDFVEKVAAIKSGAESLPSGRSRLKFKPGFFEEFGGKRRVGPREPTEAMVNHGPVVTQLKKELSAAGFLIGKDQQRDLYVVTDDGRLDSLYEVKTKSESNSIHTGIGQLELNGRAVAPKCKRTLVLPNDEAAAKIRRELVKLDIGLITFDLRGKTVKFQGLSRQIREMKAS